MNWIKVIIPFFILISCTQPDDGTGSFYLVDVDYVKENMDRPDFKLIDIRKKEDYSKGHILGSVNVWRTDLENPDYPYAGMMPGKKQVERLLREKGINTGDEIVIYDDKAECDAARLWFVLRTYRYERVKLMDGGLKAWEAGKHKLTLELTKVEQGDFTFSGDPFPWIAQKEDLLGDALVIDCRSEDEFSGKRRKKGARSGGRIPGSIQIDWSESIDWDTQTFKSLEELKEIYLGYGLAPDKPVIVYCHSGVRSSHTLFVLRELLGFSNVLNYDGSWTEWSYFTDLPIEQDSVTVYFD